MIRQLRTLALACAATLIVGAGSAWAMTVDVTINKVAQKMTVRVDGQKEYVWPVSTGAKGYETPTGNFKPFRMEAEHYSKEWDDAPMPYSIFFTQNGHAIHGSMYVKSLGRRASHGCVRLAPENAAILFDLVKEAGMQNTTITLKGGIFDQYNQPDRDGEALASNDDLDGDREQRTSKPGKSFLASLFGFPESERKKDKVNDKLAVKDTAKNAKSAKGAKKPGAAEAKLDKDAKAAKKKPAAKKKAVAAKTADVVAPATSPAVQPVMTPAPVAPVMISPAPAVIPPPPFMMNPG